MVTRRARLGSPALRCARLPPATPHHVCGEAAEGARDAADQRLLDNASILPFNGKTWRAPRDGSLEETSD